MDHEFVSSAYTHETEKRGCVVCLMQCMSLCVSPFSVPICAARILGSNRNALGISSITRMSIVVSIMSRHVQDDESGKRMPFIVTCVHWTLACDHDAEVVVCNHLQMRRVNTVPLFPGVSQGRLLVSELTTRFLESELSVWKVSIEVYNFQVDRNSLTQRQHSGRIVYAFLDT